MMYVLLAGVLVALVTVGYAYAIPCGDSSPAVPSASVTGYQNSMIGTVSWPAVIPATEQSILYKVIEQHGSHTQAYFTSGNGLTYFGTKDMTVGISAYQFKSGVCTGKSSTTYVSFPAAPSISSFAYGLDGDTVTLKFAAIDNTIHNAVCSVDGTTHTVASGASSPLQFSLAKFGWNTPGDTLECRIGYTISGIVGTQYTSTKQITIPQDTPSQDTPSQDTPSQDAPIPDPPQDDATPADPPQDIPLPVNLPVGACSTSDTSLLSQVALKTTDPWDGERPDLLDMFTRSYNTMIGADTYTLSDIKARADKQADKWQGSGPNELWQAVYAELDRIEACHQSSPNPELSIAASGNISEGDNAGFVITASPAPASPLSVSLTVTQSGDYTTTVGTSSIIIPTSGSVAYTIPTIDDNTDEADGSITVTIGSGEGYDVSSTSSATVSVSDNDETPTPSAVCTTTDQTLLDTVKAKIPRHVETGRTDLHEMFTKSYNTMIGEDTYTLSELKARADKQGEKWQGIGPNELWQAVYAELDRLEACRNN